MSTKTILIIGGIAVAGFIAYKYVTRPGAARQPGAQPGQGASSGTSGNLATTIGTWGTTLTGAASTLEKTYNSIYNWFAPADAGSTGSNINGQTAEP